MIDHEIAQLVAGVQRAVAGPHSEAKVIEAVNRLGPLHPSRYLGLHGPAPEMCAALERPATFFDTGGKSAGAAHGELRHPQCPPDRWPVYGETPLYSMYSIPIVVQTAGCNTPSKLSALDQGPSTWHVSGWLELHPLRVDSFLSGWSVRRRVTPRFPAPGQRLQCRWAQRSARRTAIGGCRCHDVAVGKSVGP